MSRNFAFQEKAKKAAENKEEKRISWLEDAVDMRESNHVDKLWKEEKILTDDLVNEFIDLKKYSSREILLSKKFYELKNGNYTDKDYQEVLSTTMNRQDVEDCLNRDDNHVELVSCYQNKVLTDEWLRLKAFISVLQFSAGIGRNLKYILKINGKIAGFISIASDIIAIGPRDQFIGWEKQRKLENLIYIGIGSTIVPTQPFGFLTNAGKLIALMFYAQQIADDWERYYSRPGDPPCKFVGATTTSLFGLSSQYLGMKKYWKVLGETGGTFELMPHDATYERIREWNKQISLVDAKMQEEYRKAFPYATVTSPRKKNLTMYYKNSHFMDKWKAKGFSRKDLSAMHKRGVFFARFFENTNEYLRGEIEQSDLKPRTTLDFDRADLNGIFNYWKRKWALNRYEQKCDDDQANHQFVMSLPNNKTTEKSFIRKFL